MTQKPKIAISVVGRFHTFDVARELAKQGSLSTLYTTYPKFATRRFGLSDNLIESMPFFEAYGRVWRRTVGRIRPIRWTPDFHIARQFDKQVAKRLTARSNVFIGTASKCLDSLKSAHRNGSLAVVDRGSAHCVAVEELLAQESELCGVRLPHPDPRFKDVELAEYANADFILVPSSFVKKTFVAHGTPESKIIQIPYGVSLEQFYPVHNKRDVFRIVYAGGIRYQKGVHYLLQAFSQLKLPNAELWLVGSVDPQFRQVLDKYASYFRHIPHMPQHELRTAYNQCSVFAICSIQEGMALVQAQAMACGLPIICTTNSGGEDLIEEGKSGFVLPIRDVSKLQECILRLYEDRDLCANMGREARRRAEGDHSWALYAENLEATLTTKLQTSTHALD